MIPTLSTDITYTGQGQGQHKQVIFDLGSMTFPSAGGRNILCQGHFFGTQVYRPHMNDYVKRFGVKLWM